MARAVAWLRKRASVLLILVVVLAVGGADWWHTIQEGRYFCAVVTAATAHPIPRPADPAANPSRENAFEFYEDFVQLGGRLGCG